MSHLNLFDRMLELEYITPAQWQAATLLCERVAASRADGTPQPSVAKVKAPDDDNGLSVFASLLANPCESPLPGECLESLSKIITQNLNSLVQSYGLEERPDPRAILRRQVRIGQ